MENVEENELLKQVEMLDEENVEEDELLEQVEMLDEESVELMLWSEEW